MSHVGRLLDEIAEEFEATGYVGLHDFTWALRGLDLGLSEDHVLSTAREAYEAFRSRTPTRLVWLTWPPDLGRAVQAADDVDLEFDIDYEQSVDTPFLALIPASG